MKISIVKIISILIIFLTFSSVNSISKIPFGNLYTTIIFQILLILLSLKERKNQKPIPKNLYNTINIYLIWAISCIIRGFFIANNYTEYRQLLIGSISCVLPVLVWIFYKPDIFYRIWSFWFKYALLVFLVYYWWNAGFTQVYLWPLLFLFCFFPLFPQKKAWIIIIGGLLFCYLGGIDNRAQLINGIISLLFGFCSYFAIKIPAKIFQLGHILCYCSIFFIFGVVLSNISGVLNEKISAEEAKHGADNELMQDSRSLIYADVITSALNNNYILFGRTPARGNDINLSYTLFFWAYDDQENIFNKDERHANEVLHLNIFTWEGLIGFILYACIYFKASYLAVYKSRNAYIKLLGCFIAFRWAFGWIEDVNYLNILNIALWAIIGMCYSDKFRNMTNWEFKKWIRQLI